MSAPQQCASQAAPIHCPFIKIGELMRYQFVLLIPLLGFHADVFAQRHGSTPHHYSPPARHYSPPPPARHYSPPPHQYSPPQRHYVPPPRHFNSAPAPHRAPLAQNRTP